MIKLILSDLDGTLIGKDLQISAKDRNAIYKLKEENINFGIVTGRDLGFFKKYVSSMLDFEMDCIANNGATLYSKKQKIYEKHIDPEHLKEMMEFVEPYLNEVHPFIADDNCVFYFMEEKPKDKFWKQAEAHMNEVGPLGEVGLLEYLRNPADHIVKLSFYTKDQDPSEFAEILQNKYGSMFEISKTCDYFVEVTRLGVNKGTTIQKMLEYYNLGMDEVAVIGDGENDIPMLKIVPTAFVMASADEKIKKYGRVVESVQEAIECIIEEKELREL